MQNDWEIITSNSSPVTASIRCRWNLLTEPLPSNGLFRFYSFLRERVYLTVAQQWSYSSQYLGTVPVFAWRDWGYPKQKKKTYDGAPDDIRTTHHQNGSTALPLFQDFSGIMCELVDRLEYQTLRSSYRQLNNFTLLAYSWWVSKM
jgi:hypothetical protein